MIPSEEPAHSLSMDAKSNTNKGKEAMDSYIELMNCTASLILNLQECEREAFLRLCENDALKAYQQVVCGE